MHGYRVIADKGSVKAPHYKVWHYFNSSTCTIWFTCSFTPILNPNLDNMTMKTILALAITTVLFVSCNRYITTYEAANGKAKCGRSIR
jgi:ligand-binding SRPBCC domain-containing protein